jgi:FkbM family methyltransferase
LRSDIPNVMIGKILILCPNKLLIFLSLIYTKLFHLGNPDPEMLQFLPNVMKGQTIIEVGSNTGKFTLLLAKKVGENGHVIACDPNPLAFHISKQNLRNTKNCLLLNVGMGAKENATGILRLQGPGDSSASVLFSKSGSLKIPCMFTTIDELVFNNKIKKLDILIIDAEGSEVEVLNGSYKTLNRLRPRILIELHPEFRQCVVKQVVDTLEGRKYKGTVFSVDLKTITYLFQPA